jgi:hypothetical protein
MAELGSFAASFMGVDRSKKANDSSRGSPRSAWFEELYERSNFSFLGVYLTHGPIGKIDWTRYTSASRKTTNNWTKSWKVLRQQGWGCCVFYVGYSPGNIETIKVPDDELVKGEWPVKKATEAGIRHG